MIIWDNHACPPMDVADLAAHLPVLDRYRAAGVTVVSLNIGYGEMPWEAHLDVAGAVRAWVQARPEGYLLAGSTADIETARATGRLAVVLDMEGAAPIAGDLGRLPILHGLGVRWILLAYNRRNWAATGVHEPDGGLTPAGRDLVAQLEDTGIVVCLSHTAPRAAEEAMEMARLPKIFSHSNAAALCAHPRNISDALAHKCAATGGVVGVNGLELFLGSDAPLAELVTRQILHLVDRIGPDHVGLGLDFVFDLDGLEREKASMAATFPAGCGYERPTRCTPPEAIPVIRESLAKAGLPDTAVAAIMGGNWLRVANRCWKTPTPT